MARRLTAFEAADVRESRRYPWSDWADGAAWEIRRGEDYDVATENMRVSLHMRAKQMSCKVRTRKVVDADGEGLVFQFLLPQEQVEAGPEPTSPADDEAVEVLYRDCIHIYETARREVTIPRADGTRQRYAAIRFKQQVEGAHADQRLVAAVASIVEHRTQGFGHLEAAGRDDLMVETFVLDESKPYHRLFSARTVQAARERMEAYYRRNSPHGLEDPA